MNEEKWNQMFEAVIWSFLIKHRLILTFSYKKMIVRILGFKLKRPFLNTTVYYNIWCRTTVKSAAGILFFGLVSQPKKTYSLDGCES